MDNALLTIQAVCEQLSLSRSTIYKEVKNGNLKCIRNPGPTAKMLFDPEDIVAWIQGKKSYGRSTRSKLL
jgi:excisionase family DNA binding protein